ncbi:MAG: NADH-quinone oxidoreductase subunit L [Acidobacteria bacterium]|nr:MAG: NADH-quinone oxidoreductase subunit L [Acidobacteriota bacterium]
MLSLIFLIPLLPLLGAVINGLFGRHMRSERMVGGVACAAVLLALLLSLGCVFQLATGLEAFEASHPSHVQVDAEGRRVEVTVAPWIPAGWEGAGVVVDWSFTLDPLSAVMILVITGVGFLIHVYSLGYMHSDPGYWRYFTYLNLFMGMMLILVLGSSFLVLFVGWEGVGLCSYLLIGFWYTDVAKASAGMKAFLVNRIGDFGFMLGMLLIFLNFGSLNIQTVLAGVQGPFLHETALLTAIGLCLFVGAVGKSAQLPLYVWLPDAMAGPTPVSALIHAATMVTAGVYMVARVSPLYAAAPAAMLTIAIVGAATALFAATIGLVQKDIKKVLAYSTVSQLGFMFLGCGVGAFAAGVFHLMTHAFFKGLLFLGSGSVIHAMSGEQDMTKMGGLKQHLPVTYKTFLIGTIAIAGFIPFAGFFSKDEILWKTWSSGHPVLWVMGSVAALLTATYMFRLVFLTFFGKCRASEEVQSHIHESPRTMTVPLMILAGLSVVGGWVGLSPALSFGKHWNLFERWLDPVFEPARRVTAALAKGEGQHGAHSMTIEWVFIGIALTIAVAGWRLAHYFYRAHPDLPGVLATKFSLVHRTLRDKYYVDEIYHFLFIDNLLRGCRALAWVDANVVDGAVNGTAKATLQSAYASDASDRWGVDGTVNSVGHLVHGGGVLLRRLQSGVIQNYAAMMILGAFGLLGLYLLLG